MQGWWKAGVVELQHNVVLQKCTLNAWVLQTCRAATHRVVGRVHEQVGHGLLIRACMQGEPPQLVAVPSADASLGH